MSWSTAAVWHRSSVHPPEGLTATGLERSDVTSQLHPFVLDAPTALAWAQKLDDRTFSVILYRS
jgi:hypothetical protein